MNSGEAQIVSSCKINNLTKYAKLEDQNFVQY